MSRKYVLTDDSITVDGRRLYSIECVRPFGRVKRGERGGYIEHEGNLSHYGKAWVEEGAMVMDDAVVEEDAYVCFLARVRGAARISGKAKVVIGNVSGSACISDNVWIWECDEISGNAIVRGNVDISGRVRISGDATVYEGAHIWCDAQVDGDAQVHGSAVVTGDAWVSGSAEVLGDACIYGTARINGEARVGGNAHIGGDALVSQGDDYLHIDNLYPRFGKYNEYCSVTAFVTRNKTIEVVHTLLMPVTVEEFEAEVEKMYRGTDYMMQYQAVISLIKIWSEINRK